MNIKKTNVFAKTRLRKINPKWFTGPVHMTEISDKIKSKGQNIYHVTFEKGAKTKIHIHDGDQILLVTGGNGSLEIFSKHGNKKDQFYIRKTQRTHLASGDIVFIPRRTLHTHGSVKKKHSFSHIAFNIISGKEFKTIWYESDFKRFVKSTI